MLRVNQAKEPGLLLKFLVLNKTFYLFLSDFYQPIVFACIFAVCPMQVTYGYYS